MQALNITESGALEFSKVGPVDAGRKTFADRIGRVLKDSGRKVELTGWPWDRARVLVDEFGDDAYYLPA